MNHFDPTFISVERITDQVLLQEDAVIFDTVPIFYGDCRITVPASEIFLWTSGYYYVYFNIYHQEPCQFTIFKNSVPVPGTTVGSPTGAAQNSSAVIIDLQPIDVLVNPYPFSPTGFAASIQFVNHTSYAPVINLNGQSGSGSAQPQIVATAVIFRLA